ncbi:MAG TPA: D-alanyl-D-alanine dipeptidase, partial [Gemmatimonadota bacterium]|nr:D-alanyl-D-alanine dipeptidase [Gemmatimonadota bacterium]
MSASSYVRPARALGLAVAMLSCASAAREAAPQLVDVGAADPELGLDIRYATEDNFLGRAVYDAARCLLVPDAA